MTLDPLGLTFDRFFEGMRDLTRDARNARLLYASAFAAGRFEPEGFFGPKVAPELARRFRVELPAVDRVVSEDGPSGVTSKAALRLGDGAIVECVRIPQPDGLRGTLCVSSQVGCRMGCAFCETGSRGLSRNLEAREIVAQAVASRSVLGWDWDNIVFMGMGEPLDNFDELALALSIFFDVAGMRMSQERVTVCTVGRVDGIARLKALGYRRLNLSVSLNAATDEKRGAIMPINGKYPLAVLAAALADYAPRPNFALGVNYCLVPGSNDGESDADGVAAFCAACGRTMVNVIPYNPGTSPIGRAPEDAETDRFAALLYARGLSVRKRATRGRSIMAGCGQLGGAGTPDAEKARVGKAGAGRARSG